MEPEKDLYRIPGESPLDEALRIADTQQYTPETQPEAFAFMKDIEKRIVGYRETAQPVKRTGVARYVSRFMPARSPMVTELIEQEARLGGTLHSKAPHVVSQRFWYHDNNDWFFESVDTQRRTTVIHIETTPTSLHKSHAGQEIRFIPGEAERFTQAAIAYEELVQNLYSSEDQRAA